MTIIPILVQVDEVRVISPDEKIIFPSSQCAILFTFCLACFRGHVNCITVPCFAANIESSTTIFEADVALSVQSAEMG